MRAGCVAIVETAIGIQPSRRSISPVFSSALAQVIRVTGVMFEVRDPFQCFDIECRCIAGNRRLARAFDLRDSAGPRRNQFVQLTHELGANQRHPRASYCGISRRELFQTSPQLVQRQ
jgi:hypothetical protein